MKFTIYYCEDSDYSKNCFESKIEHRLLTKSNGDKLEIDCHFLPEVKGLSEGKFNVLFYDKNDELADDDRKYFAKASWIQRRKLKLHFGTAWIQTSESNWFKQATLTGILAILGYFIGQKIGIKDGYQEGLKRFQQESQQFPQQSLQDSLRP